MPLRSQSPRARSRFGFFCCGLVPLDRISSPSSSRAWRGPLGSFFNSLSLRRASAMTDLVGTIYLATWHSFDTDLTAVTSSRRAMMSALVVVSTFGRWPVDEAELSRVVVDTSSCAGGVVPVTSTVWPTCDFRSTDGCAVSRYVIVLI